MDPTRQSAQAQRDVQLRGEIDRVWRANRCIYEMRKGWKQLRRGDVDCCRRQSSAHPLRGGHCAAGRRVPDCSIKRHEHATPTVSSRPPASECRAVSHRDRADPVAPADARLSRATHPRRPVEERHHSVPEAVRRPRGLRRTTPRSYRAIAAAGHGIGGHNKTLDI